MKILFIGGTGNISADCAELLHRQGNDITVLSRGNSPVPAAYESIIADRGDAAAMRAALGSRQFDSVINFLGYRTADLEIDCDVLSGRMGQYIFISTAMVYAKPHTQLPITELAPMGNRYSDYAQQKQECEEWLMARREEDGLPFTIARPSHTYSKRWIPNTITSRGYTAAARMEQGQPMFVPDDGETLWTLTTTTDFAAGLAGLVGNEKAVGESFHITSDEALSWNRIYGELADALGVELPTMHNIPVDFICDHFPDQIGGLRGDKANPGVFDNSKLKRFVPGFECVKPFREGVREAVAYLRAHPEEQHINAKVNETFNDIIAAWQAKS